RGEQLEAYAEGLVCLTGAPEAGLLPSLLRQRRYEEAAAAARRLRALYGRENCGIEVTRTLTEGEVALSHRLFDLAEHLGLDPIITNAVRHATKMEFAPYEAQCRIRLHLPPAEQHAELPLNGERYLKRTAGM